ncbi:putative E3 ubiquitin ligase complex SCF subunit sconC [Hypsibius exemplaris]|uniref:E3 ubiquitin ligase complex SCF subunit sconC n=1 Tax=Hypsibius exemplaris TaxID=2072580 RepID=A0A9X6NAS0_HYPEX|nr:putative E3 ubiquitin ligase complex SCF subunit sconC [Hypsibius exemplaris]
MASRNGGKKRSAPAEKAESTATPSVPELAGSNTMRLKSGDGAVVTLSMEAAKMSKILRQMIEDLTVNGTRPVDWENLDPIPLTNVSGNILRKIIIWMDWHMKNDPPATEKEEDDLSPFTEEISEWDEEFVKVDQGTLFELILATNYLNLKPLRTVCCKTVANTLKKKSVEQIREMYNIKNDFTPEEEEELRRENQLLGYE